MDRRSPNDKVEEQAYSLLGLFGMFMPLIYGEEENAYTRRRRDIDAGAAMATPSAMTPFNFASNDTTGNT
jgi:hypothetical protein